MGVRVLFENSTVCRFKYASELVPGLLDYGQVIAGMIFQCEALLESLILAQDERWRRA
jgi:hypothetical protein